MIKFLGKIIHSIALILVYLILAGLTYISLYTLYLQFDAPRKQINDLSTHLSIKNVIYQKATHNKVFGCTYILAEYTPPKNIGIKIKDMNLRPTPVDPWTVYGEFPFEKCTQIFSEKYKNIINDVINSNKAYWWNLNDNSESATLLILKHNLILKVRYGD